MTRKRSASHASLRFSSRKEAKRSHRRESSAYRDDRRSHVCHMMHEQWVRRIVRQTNGLSAPSIHANPRMHRANPHEPQTYPFYLFTALIFLAHHRESKKPINPNIYGI